MDKNSRKKTVEYILNPQTNREVKKNSRTYKKLIIDCVLKQPEQQPELMGDGDDSEHDSASSVEAYTDDLSLDTESSSTEKQVDDSKDSDIDEWINSMDEEYIYKLYDYVNLLQKKNNS